MAHCITFWKLELEKCKKSPYYFFKNYMKIKGKSPATRVSEKEYNEFFYLNYKQKQLKK
tara:strand:- start:2600 stop:2776 length:177 start_codon:yes stop_codon:yes gene_type:complete